MKAIILAGGKGTRLGEKTRELPKPMLPILGKPLLEYHIELLAAYGVKDIWITVNYLKEHIIHHFGDGSNWNVNIHYAEELSPLGTVGGVKTLEKEMTEDFFVVYGDVMMEVDLERLAAFHQDKQAAVTLVLHPNDHPYDSDLVQLGRDGKIKQFYPKPHAEGLFFPNMVNAGLYLFTPAIFPWLESNKKADFGKDIFPSLVYQLPVYGYNTSEYLKDMGTPDRLLKVEKDLASGKIASRSLENPQKAIFLDRDGVLNEDSGFIHRPEDFHLFPFTKPAIAKINASPYLAIVVTNQSVIARNRTTIEGLEQIHAKMEWELGASGAWVDAVYYCPHHPHKGFPDENPEFKIDCECRKPKPGMLLDAARHFHIDLSQSWMIGDNERDILAGKAAGCITVGVSTGNGVKSGTTLPDFHFEQLAEAVNFIVEAPYGSLAEQLWSMQQQHVSGPFVIAIGGNTRAGKSTLAKSLWLDFKTRGITPLYVSLDDWLVTADKRHAENTVFDNFQYERLRKDFVSLLEGKKIQLEGYSRHPQRKIVPKSYQYTGQEVVIIEGVIALSVPEILTRANVRIFKSIEEKVLQERMAEYYRWKGLDEAGITFLWNKRHAEEYQLIAEDVVKADIVI